jgi:hypothetical protein
MYPDYLISSMRRNVRAHHNQLSEEYILSMTDDVLYSYNHPIEREDIDREMNNLKTQKTKSYEHNQ